MDLTRYPLDRQECDLRILSCKYSVRRTPSHGRQIHKLVCMTDAYDEEQLTIRWANDEAISKNDEIKLPDMKLLRLSMGECNGTFPAGAFMNRP